PHVPQEIVAVRQIVEPRRIGPFDVPGLDQVAEMAEPVHMRPDPRLGVTHRCARLDDEIPVARLKEQELAYEQVEGVAPLACHAPMPPHEPRGIPRRVVHVTPGPGRLRSDPHFAVAPRSPGRSAGSRGYA